MLVCGLRFRVFQATGYQLLATDYPLYIITMKNSPKNEHLENYILVKSSWQLAVGSWQLAVG